MSVGSSKSDIGVSHPERRDYLTIMAVSFTVLTLQIALTRILSVVVWYHFAFLTISIVMLGLGVPGVWFALMRKPLRWLPHCLLASGIAVPAAVATIIQYATEFVLDRNATVWIIASVLPAMLALGSAVCLLLMKSSGRTVARMYGADLFGACAGALLIIPLLHAIPTPQIAAGCGLLPLLALAQYGLRWRLAGGIAAAAIVSALLFSPLFQVTRTKSYDENFVRPIYEKWTPLARLTLFDEKFDVFDQREESFSWGRGAKTPRGSPIPQYWLEQDASAGTPITRFTGDLSKVAHLMFDVTTLAYQIRPPDRVVIIGSGGGRDILTALISGASDVHAVELNRHTIEIVTDRYGKFSGNIYHRPGVRAIEREGRSYLTHSNQRFDLIQISLIDSWAASAAGAFALAENNLYTVEAFELYLERLSPAGLLSTTRWMNEIPRLIMLSRAALSRAGFEHPERHIMMASAGSAATVLLSKRAFSPADIARLQEVSDERGFRIHYPVTTGRPVDLAVEDFVAGRYERLSRRGLNVAPPTDDSPYFFHVVSPFADAEMLERDAFAVTDYDVNWSSTIILRQVMAVVSGLAIALFTLPFLVENVFRRRRGSIALLRATLFFAAIGAGFMLLENTLVQHFVLYLGHPSYAVTVVIASLLLGMGVGSTFAGKVGVVSLQRLGWIVPSIVITVVLALPTLFETTLGLPLPARIAASSVILLPLGAALGLFFPLGMLRFGDANKPWFWAVNGAFGVVASVMSLALSMEFGFQLVGQLSAGIYGLAWICLREAK